jgi:hypothetical protein
MAVSGRVSAPTFFGVSGTGPAGPPDGKCGEEDGGSVFNILCVYRDRNGDIRVRGRTGNRSVSQDSGLYSFTALHLLRQVWSEKGGRLPEGEEDDTLDSLLIGILRP